MFYHKKSIFHRVTFFLIRIPGLEDIHMWISLPFCSVYLVVLLGNATILLVIKVEQTLREPMFYFLAILSTIDLALSTTSVPCMLGIFWFDAHEVNYGACVTQMFLIHAFTGMEAEVLLAMAFDRYVAICAPLHYTTVLTSQVLVGISMCLVIHPVLLTLPMIYLIYWLPFCQAHVIAHSYCEHMGTAKLSCGNIRPHWHLICLHLLFPYSYVWTPPGYIHILVANLYLIIPPFLNPIIYGVRTKQIREQVLYVFTKK
uniref:Olfactory receptor n=1 Tax=Macaca nemestrina TaxID=9545 RepID=A0A2K6DIR8_MACNE